QHLPHACFRRISPQRFLVSRFVAKTRPAFRNLWRGFGIPTGCFGGFAKKSAKICFTTRRGGRGARRTPNAPAARHITRQKGGSPNAAFRRGSGPSEKVFNELWKPSRGRLGARRGCKVLDDHKAVDLSLQVGV